MRAWSTIVASGPCLIVNLSAERGKPIGNISAGQARPRRHPRARACYLSQATN
jgi:hypothetical protein